MSASAGLLAQLEQLRQQSAYHNRQYYLLDDPQIPDAEYDRLFRQLQQLEAEHPELIQQANQAFDTLRRVMSKVHHVKSPTKAVDLDALFVWSCMHGLAGILSANCTTHLTLSPAVHKQAVSHVMGLIGHGLSTANR